MRILTGIDIPFTPFGGSPILCDDWYSQPPPGVQVRFLTLAPPEGTGRWWAMEDVHFLEARKARTQEGFDAYVQQLRREVARHVADFRPTLIHCQHLNFGLSRAFAEEAPGIAKVGICHGTDVQSATQSGFFLANLRAIRAGMNALLFPARRMADDYFAVDPCELEHTVLPHGIPDRFYAPRPEGQRAPSLRVLYAGRLTPWKGADIAVSAMRYLPEDVSLSVVGGEDSPGYLDQLRAEVTTHGLEARVHFEGHLPRERLVERFSDFDVCVFPSRRLEAFSLTTIEAQARGLVVVYAGAGGGIVDAVGESGLQVRENTPEVLASSLARLRAEPALLEHYRARGYRNAEQYRMSVIRPRFFALAREHALRSRANGPPPLA
ncbi:glycosyltransferase family 4 protein [Hyalangium rubrum]|uniref:Glycosyltransferase family 4 protein n=1 Tax=Hyalangium rubrum TaxID=3103134 RepID=A0ABU5GYR8_9BACT|nr:glycosyltransferase family 4 protein [Hyalangium sp. s54d21]MDY7226305.1 glycosyltransferase family 4 protein [Hyalangium sp. s54d21]